MNITLKAAQLPKSIWHYYQNEKVDYEGKYSYLKPKLDEIIDIHHGYSVPRIKTELEESYRLVVKHKVLRRLLRTWEMRSSRAFGSSTQSPIREAVGGASGDLKLVGDVDEGDIDLFESCTPGFTELRYENGIKKACLIPVIGHRSKLIFGWAVGQLTTTEVTVRAWNRTRKTFNRFEVGLGDTILPQDQDSLFTSNNWSDQILIEDKVNLS